MNLLKFSMNIFFCCQFFSGKGSIGENFGALTDAELEMFENKPPDQKIRHSPILYFVSSLHLTLNTAWIDWILEPNILVRINFRWVIFLGKQCFPCFYGPHASVYLRFFYSLICLS